MIAIDVKVQKQKCKSDDKMTNLLQRRIKPSHINNNLYADIEKKLKTN